jgi:hypothetical protein
MHVLLYLVDSYKSPLAIALHTKSVNPEPLMYGHGLGLIFTAFHVRFKGIGSPPIIAVRKTQKSIMTPGGWRRGALPL